MNGLAKVLLPPNNYFSVEQIQVIKASGNLNVVAGPGSGKTTVLTAKLLSLLNAQKHESKGICCITHTNVAVEEIKARIISSGSREIQYPNFIGTIQSFFDHFFSRKAFGILLPGKKIRVLDDEEYRIIFSKKFKNLVPWWTVDAPNPATKNARLIIEKNGVFYFENDGKPSYRKSINAALIHLFKNGIVNNVQMTELAEWYIAKNSDKLSTAFSERFQYLILDEAQDTNNKQYQLLNKLVKTSEIEFQKFGDPYQSLYTIFGNENLDTWLPYSEQKSNKTPTIEIAETARFGPNIAKLVKDVCFEDYTNFHSSRKQNPFHNYFLTFETGNELKEKYQTLINYCKNINTKYDSCLKKDSLVAPLHNDLKKYFKDYEKPQKYVHINEDPYKRLFHYAISQFAFLNGVSIEEQLTVIRENVDLKVSFVELISKLQNSFQDKRNLELLIEKFLPAKSKIDVKKITESFIFNVSHDRTTFVRNSQVNDKLCLSTIHSIKGETHRSTFLLLDSQMNIGQNNSFLETLFPFLIGNRVQYQDKENKKIYKDYLKLAYVALSRPSYLAGVAIPSHLLDDQKKKNLIAYGWEEAK